MTSPTTQPPPRSSITPPNQWHEFLIFFVHRHFDFRYPELKSVLTLQGLSLAEVMLPTFSTFPSAESSPILRIRLPTGEHAKFLSIRGILVKGVYEVWGHTPTDSYPELVQAVASYQEPHKQRLIDDVSCSWCIRVEGFGKKLSMQEQEQRRQYFSTVLPFAGPIQLNQPQEQFLILEEYGIDQRKPALQLFFLREVAGSERNRGRGGARDLIDQQTLKRRAYIGPTSMESEMALLMANLALVQLGDVVMDPFVGTGSVLIPCATHGALCIGTDIDIRVLMGTGVGVNKIKSIEQTQRVNVLTNFKQYGLPLPELIRADNSQNPFARRCRDWLDAIVCDPPYGIRAGARKSGRRPGLGPSLDVDQLSAEEKASYIPPTQPYAAEDVMSDLLAFAATTLRSGGRLVYWLPTMVEEYTDADLPSHPQLTVISNAEQKLTMKYARRLITMVKNEVSIGCEVTGTERTLGEVSFANLRDKIVNNVIPKTKKQKTKEENELG